MISCRCCVSLQVNASNLYIRVVTYDLPAGLKHQLALYLVFLLALDVLQYQYCDMYGLNPEVFTRFWLMCRMLYMNSSAMLLKYYVGLVRAQALRLAQALPLATQVSISPTAHAAHAARVDDTCSVSCWVDAA